MQYKLVWQGFPAGAGAAFAHGGSRSKELIPSSKLQSPEPQQVGPEGTCSPMVGFHTVANQMLPGKGGIVPTGIDRHNAFRACGNIRPPWLMRLERPDFTS